MHTILENLGTIIVSALVLLVAALAILVIRRDKKLGKSSCCGACAGCPMSGSCHSAPSEKNQSVGS